MKKFSIIAIAMCIGAAVFSSCKKDGESTAEASIIGQWSYKDLGAEYIYNFVDDSTGSYDAGALGKKDFKYKKTADTLSITFNGNTFPMELAYKISNDTLTVFDSFGKPVPYAKK